MVVRLKTLIGVLLFGLLWLSSAQAATRISPQILVLGNPINLVINGKHVSSDWDHMDLAPLKRQFAIYDIDGDDEHMSIKLYPRSTGKLVIPAMSHGNIQIPKTVIEVEKNSDIRVDWQAPSKLAYAHQVLYWKATASANDEVFMLEMKTREAPKEADYDWLKLSKGMPQSSLLGKQNFTFLAAVQFDQPSRRQHAPQPYLEAKHSGNAPWRFFPPNQMIHVKPLPAFIPEFVPQGDLKVSSELAGHFLPTGTLLHWHLQIEGKDVSPSQMPNIDSQIRFQPGIEWLTPEKSRQSTFQQGGLLTTQRVDQPFRLKGFGWYQLPEIRLTYFNPSSGKLEDAYANSQWVFSVPLALFYVLTVLEWIVAVLTVILLIGLMLDMLATGILKARLRSAESVEAVWKAITCWSRPLMSESSNLTFGKWQTLILAQNTECSPALQALVNSLDQWHFSDKPVGNDLENKVTLAAINWSVCLSYFDWKMAWQRLGWLVKNLPGWGKQKIAD